MVELFKTIVVIPCLFMNVLYTQEVEGINYPEYFDSEQEAREAIATFEAEVGDAVDHYLVQVRVDTHAQTLIDRTGYDWVVNLRSQAGRYACV